MRWVAIAAGVLVVIVLVALQFQTRSLDPTLIGTWHSLDKDGRWLIFRADGYGLDPGYGLESIDNDRPDRKNFRWWTAFGRLNIETWDEEGNSQKVGSMEYMLREGTLTFVGEVPKQWSSVYSMKSKAPE